MNPRLAAGNAISSLKYFYRINRQEMKITETGAPPSLGMGLLLFLILLQGTGSAEFLFQ